MLSKYVLPKNLQQIIGEEEIEFAVKAKRDKPFKKSLFPILFGVFWLAFTSIFVIGFFGPIFMGKEVHFTSNGTPTVASPDNLEPLLFPGLIIGLFVLIGIGILSLGIYSFLKDGGYFVGTPTRFISFTKGKTNSIDWEQFSGNVEINGNELEGNLILEMRTGKMVSSKNSGSRYVPNEIYLSGITNVFEIEKICRKRIKENDPTPPLK